MIDGEGLSTPDQNPIRVKNGMSVLQLVHLIFYFIDL